MKPWIAKSHLPFRKEYANRALDFFPQCLVHHVGKWAGQPFKLEPFQSEPLKEVFGRVDDEGNRYIREVFWELPKKNGKSPIAGGIVCKLAFADNENAPHIYGAASDREQAEIVFEYVDGMIERSPEIAALCRVSSGRKIVKIPGSRGFYKVVSADVSGKHGYNTHGLVVDEVHALSDFKLWDVLTFGAGAARTQPLFVGLTTAGVVGESPVAEEKHELALEILEGLRPCPDWFFPVVFSAPKDAEWSDPMVWEATNPALHRFLAIEQVQKEFEEASANLRQQNNFRRYRLNQWVQQLERWIDLDVWDGCTQPADLSALKEYPCYIGLDLSSRVDLTAASLIFVLPGRKLFSVPFMWVPEATIGTRDSIEADSYRKWIESGDLMACPGSEIDYGQVEEFIVKLKTERGLKIREVVYDPMFAGQMAQRLEKKGFVMVEFSQRGYSHFNEACLEFEGAIESGRFAHDGNPVARWSANCVQVKQGPNGVIRPEKPDRNRTKKRIDPIVASLMGIRRAMVSADTRPSMYSSPETAVM